MLRFILWAVPLVFVLLALFGVLAPILDLEPAFGSVLRLRLEAPRIPLQIVLGGWLLESFGLVALYLLIEGRCGVRWLDGLVAGWLAWLFRGPFLVVTVVLALGQRQGPWWHLAMAWWFLYSLAGIALGILSWRMEKVAEKASAAAESDADVVLHPSSQVTEDDAVEDVDPPSAARDPHNPL